MSLIKVTLKKTTLKATFYFVSMLLLGLGVVWIQRDLTGVSASTSFPLLEWSELGKEITNVTGSTTQNARIIGADGENFYVGWLVDGNQLYVNKFDVDGVEIWSSPLIFDVFSESYDPFTFKLLSAPEDALYVGYVSPDNELMVQKVMPDGSLGWGADGVFIDYVHTSYDVFPILSAQNGYFYAVYSPINDNTVSLGVSEKIVAQLLDSNGNKLWNNGVEIEQGSNYLGTLSFNSAIDGNGDLVIGLNRPYDDSIEDPEWIGAPWLGSEIALYKINILGNFVWDSNGVLVSRLPIDWLWLHPRLIADDENNILIYWFDERVGWHYGQVFAQKLTSTGVALWDDPDFFENNDVCSGTMYNLPGTKFNPEPLMWSDDPDCVGATSCDDFQRPRDFYGSASDCMSDEVCTCFWVEDEVLQVSEMFITNMDLLYDYPRFDTLTAFSDDEGGFYIPWYNSDGPPNSIYIQYINSSGVKQWGENGKSYSGYSTYDEAPKLIDVGKGFLTVWAEMVYGSNNNYNAKMELITKDGEFSWADNYLVPIENRWCSNTGGAEATVRTIPFDVALGVAGWPACWDWCARNMTYRQVCQFNADGPRNCWIKTAPSGSPSNCTWSTSSPPYGGALYVGPYSGQKSMSISGNISWQQPDVYWNSEKCTSVSVWTSGSGVFASKSYINLNVEKTENSFDSGAGEENVVNSSVRDSNGNVYVVGGIKYSAMSIWKFNSSGEVDSNFNSPNGFITFTTDGSNVEGLDIKIDLNGKLVVSGIVTNESGNCNTTIWRYNTDGSLDSSFGGVGFVTFANNAGGTAGSRGMGIVVDSDNNYYVVGHDAASNDYPDMAIWKIKNDGSLDENFGDGTCYNGVGTAGAYGCVVFSNATGFDDSQDKGLGIVQQPDGKLIIVGYSMNSETEESDMVIWRYNPNGTLDDTFGDGSCNNGVGFGGNYGCSIHNSAAEGDDCDRGWRVVLDGDKIVVVGQSGGTDGFSDMAVWRYNSNGTLDTTFNSVGYVTHHNASGGNVGDKASDIVVMDDGKYLIGGSSKTGTSWNDNTRAVLWRYNSDGTMDDTFGDGSCNNGVGINGSLGCVVFDNITYDNYRYYIRHQISIEEIDDGYRAFTAGTMNVTGDADILLLDWVETDGPYCCSPLQEQEEEDPEDENEDPAEEDEASAEEDPEEEDEASAEEDPEEEPTNERELSKTGQGILYVMLISLFSLGVVSIKKK